MSDDIGREKAEEIAESFVMEHYNAAQPNTLSVELEVKGQLVIYLVELEALGPSAPPPSRRAGGLKQNENGCWIESDKESLVFQSSWHKYQVQVSANDGSIKGYKQIYETPQRYETDDEPDDEPDDDDEADDDPPLYGTQGLPFFSQGFGRFSDMKQEKADNELGKLARDILKEKLKDTKEEMDKQKKRKEIRKLFFIGE